jgi:hypothetical protein
MLHIGMSLRHCITSILRGVVNEDEVGFILCDDYEVHRVLQRRAEHQAAIASTQTALLKQQELLDAERELTEYVELHWSWAQAEAIRLIGRLVSKGRLIWAGSHGIHATVIPLINDEEVVWVNVDPNMITYTTYNY